MRSPTTRAGPLQPDLPSHQPVRHLPAGLLRVRVHGLGARHLPLDRRHHGGRHPHRAHSGTVAAENTWSADRTAGFTAIRYRNVIEGDVRTCAAVDHSRGRYPQVGSGATGDLVTAAQCLLSSAGLNTGTAGPSGIFDDTTILAAQQFQTRVGLPATGAVDAGLTIDGKFGANTTAAAKRYQTAAGLTSDGIVGPWASTPSAVGVRARSRSARPATPCTGARA
ncbi:peptidoglycan-binding domain-containing protein [Actinophytocola sp.]|uniref:peptidoglycan-binding domain-containing protein n=1 Tax=Actinophytocola sp. TaxID=1872138 RepID=UPI002ED23482